MSAAVEFSPRVVNYTNIEEQIYAARSKISDGSVLVVNLEQLTEYSTVTVCLLIDILRTAKLRKCRVEFHSIGEQLNKLLVLYQINPWVDPAASPA